MRTFVMTSCAVVIAGCSGGVDPSGPTAESTVEPLSAGEYCATTRADAQIPTNGGYVQTPEKYDHPDCRYAYLIDYTAPANTGAIAGAFATDQLPTDQATCVLANLRFYVWDDQLTWVNNQPVTKGTLIESVITNAVWTGSYCTFGGSICAPSNPCNGTFKSGHTYRLAVSARQGYPDGTWASRSAMVIAQPTVTGGN